MGMNEFRKKVLGGDEPSGPLLRAKELKYAPSHSPDGESFAALAIPRSEGRKVNHRDVDRYRLGDEQVCLIHEGEKTPVQLINLSGGGAMIEGAPALRLWDRVEIEVGGCGRLEAIVRWVKDERVGLEFAHETRIEAAGDEVADMLRAVIHRSFPDIALAALVAEPEEDQQAAAAASGPDEFHAVGAPERELRHPLIWTGLIHHNHDSTPVRLRNISANGAMVEGSGTFPLGAELLLDLGEAGAIFSSVHWAHGDQAGLKFHVPYDVAALAKARPEVAAAKWVAPAYLREDRSGSSPWATQWGRSDLGRLHSFLTGKKR